ncbi:probable S-adenosylmethionine-dependent methyltransferase CRG1 isoform X2 [Seriola lalandi dorsalis]|uniref:probable S-adenosylmethionine-dependent methyltransferase CRG1 isoform X2 n=1 Tax=Seriola lalandi dorsalis TaxID=1841481 RepID=UPI000C6F785C|nr:probable S-adenosylmethionine-dependent methyltransferase CRG1 isoform X2 [Seriola lalandi dorsalis]
MAVRLFEGKKQAAAYLQYRLAPHELTSRIMSFMEKKTPKQFNLAVDVGCGSGQGTTLLAPYFTKVVGTDVSPTQLEMALVRGFPANVSYKQCPAEELPFTSGEVDLVTAMTAAHWFDHQRFLQEADRVLRPGGCLALLSYTMDMELEYGDVSNTLNDIFLRCPASFPKSLYRINLSEDLLRHVCLLLLPRQRVERVSLRKKNLATEWIYWHGGDLLQLPGPATTGPCGG